MYKLLAPILLMFVVVCSQANAEIQFVKYKHYLIPIIVDEEEEEECNYPLIVSTDYSDWDYDIGRSAGLGSPGGDAGEAAAMTHFLAYSNYFDVRGIISSITIGTGDVAEINNPINAYLEDVNEFDWDQNYGYQTAFVVKEGIQLIEEDPPELPEYNMPDAMNNEAVQLIANEAILASPSCPLNVVVWGGILEVSAALQYLSQNNSAAQANVKVIANGAANRKEQFVKDGGVQQRAWEAINSLATTYGNVIKFDELSYHMVGRRFESDNDVADKVDSCGQSDENDSVVYYRDINNCQTSETTEDIMDSITGQPHNSNLPVSPSNFQIAINSGLREFLQGARYQINANHYNNANPPALNSMKSGDSLTLMFLLDDYFGIYNSLVKNYVRPDSNHSNGTTSTDDEGVAPDNATLKIVYEHYRDLIDDLYSTP